MRPFMFMVKRCLEQSISVGSHLLQRYYLYEMKRKIHCDTVIVKLVMNTYQGKN